MGIRNSNDPRGSNVPLVDARIGTAFAIVEKVSDAIDQIRYVAEHLYAVQLKDVEFNNDVAGEVIQWRYVGETAWRTLVTYTDLLGSDITNVVADMVALRDEMLGIAVQGVNEMNAQNLSGLLDKGAARQNLGLGNVDNTADVDKPVSLAVQLALDLKADAASLLAHATNINNPHQATKAQVGLGNVDNTSDMDKPISTAMDAALIGLDEEISILRETKEDSLPTLNATTTHFLRGDKTWIDFAVTVRDTALTGLSTATNRVVEATDSFLTSIGLLQKQVSDNKTTADAHIARTDNPHGVTKVQIELGNVDNTSDLNKPISTATQNALNLKADLVNGLVPTSQLPSYVDDVLEYADLAAFPVTGESGKIYIAKNGGIPSDPSRQYRWSGTQYVENFASPGTTDNVVEGATNLYYTAARVRALVLTGLDLASGAAITAADSVLSAFGKLQKQASDLATAVSLKANALNAALTGTTTVERLDVGNILKLPEWTTATRPANALGRIGYNTDLKAYEGYSDGGWNSIGGGAKGAPGNAVFYENAINVTGSYTITTGYNAMTAGPITVNDGAVVTVPDGSVLTIV